MANSNNTWQQPQVHWATFEPMALLKPLPGKLLDNLEGVAGYDRADFVAAHETGKPITSIRLNPWKNISGQQAPFSFALDQQVPWSRHGYYLTQRPSFTFDPLFHAGLYYVQEASSMFLEQAFG